MATYQYTKPYAQLQEDKLKSECIAAGLPVTDVQRLGDEGETIFVITNRELTPAEVTTLDGLVAAHDGRPRKTRRLYDIYTDLNPAAPSPKITAAQLNTVWTDLTSGTPPKLSLDVGMNAASIFVMHFLGATVAGLTTAEKNEAKRRAIAFYCQDNVNYLVNPAFDPSINIPGDEVVG